ncbi:MAG: ketol-acid reductoisomerase [Candidatus Eisenbacteria bacterium]|nr:ketol-acid reductoisomerase [Candidatus Eisenbacteria bacterium]
MRDWTLGILGYGNQGRAQAMNLRDSGYRVRVGARPGGFSASAAAGDGFPVDDPGDLAHECDLIALLTPDETHVPLFARMALSSRPQVIVLAHGFTLRFAEPALREEWDVVLVSPYGPGTALRAGGRPGGLPALIAVHRDGSGHARERARAYAVAAGCSARSLLDASVAEEAEMDLFGEQAVLCGGLAALVQAAWETLVAKGYDPVLAYMECVQQIGLTAEMISRFGIAGMRERISSLALYGDLTRGPRLIDAKVRHALDEVLDEIRGGEFVTEWTREVERGFPASRRGLEESRRRPIEDAGSAARRFFVDRPEV